MAAPVIGPVLRWRATSRQGSLHEDGLASLLGDTPAESPRLVARAGHWLRQRRCRLVDRNSRCRPGSARWRRGGFSVVAAAPQSVRGASGRRRILLPVRRPAGLGRSLLREVWRAAGIDQPSAAFLHIPCEFFNGGAVFFRMTVRHEEHRGQKQQRGDCHRQQAPMRYREPVGGRKAHRQEQRFP